jgi:hypothetical protein
MDREKYTVLTLVKTKTEVTINFRQDKWQNMENDQGLRIGLHHGMKTNSARKHTNRNCVCTL